MRILKYKIDVTGKQVIKLPADSEVLTVQVQNGVPHIWAKVYDEESILKAHGEYKEEEHHISSYGTGNEIKNSCGRYIGTYQLDEGSLVFHVFEQVAGRY